MEKLLDQIREYLNMDTEISYEEFAKYYEDVMAALNDRFQDMAEEEIHQGRFILLNLHTNAEDRAKRKGPQAKKYKKMMDKTKLWAEALQLKLVQLGLNQKQIDDAYEAINDTI